MKSHLSSQKGVALIAALAFLVITMALIGTAMLVSLSDVRLSTSNTRTIQAQFAAEAAIDETVLTLWHGITTDIRAAKADEPNYSNIAVDDYRKRWDTKGIKSALDADDKVVYGEWGEVKTRNGTLNLEGDEDATYVVDVSRKDVDYDESELRLVATVTLPGGSQRKLEQVYSVTLPPFELEFALLSDVINCTFCHSAFTSIEAGYDCGSETAPNNPGDCLVDLTNKDDRIAAAAGTQRIRVAGLSDLQISTGYDYLHTLISGTIYTRGAQNIMYDGDGNCGTGGGNGHTGRKCAVIGPVFEVSDGEPIGVVSSNAYEAFNKGDASTTDAYLLSCTPEENDGNSGCEQENARFYANYPSKKDGQPLPIDGTIPDVQSFPSPVPDTNGNRLIDNDEWEDAVQEADATNQRGELLDAHRIYFSETNDYGVPQDTGSTSLTVSYDSESYTITGLHAGHNNINNVEVSSDRGINGNLILLGTDTDPIKIDETVYIDGDLIIKGPIAPGNYGVIIARRNVYIIGDLIYDCNGDSSGTGCNYETPSSLPRLGIMAGGIMMIGSPAEKPNDNPLQGELLMFNRRQEDKLDANLIETPRYYVWRYGDTAATAEDGLYRCNEDECRNWTASKTKLTGSSIDDAAILAFSPFENWLAQPGTDDWERNDSDTEEVGNVDSFRGAIRNEQILNVLWQQYGNHSDGVILRNDANKAQLRIDGLLYSNGAILGYFPASLNSHNTYGGLTLNGSIIAYETGLLIYGNGRQDKANCEFGESRNLFTQKTAYCVGLRIQYDKRLPSLIDLREDEPALFRTSYQWLSIEEAE